MTAVVVPLDGSEHALVALPVARSLAELHGATLYVVHVARASAPPAATLARIGLTPGELRGSVLDTTTGDPAAGIVRTARDRHAALIVMCTHTAADLAKTVGRTALAVLQTAPCPVVLARPERGVVPWTLRRMLLPHDGTPTTSAAILPAADLARLAGAELSVLHVAAAPARLPIEHGTLVPPRYVDQAHHEWPAWATEFLGRMGCLCPLDMLKVRMSLGRGAPGEEVLRTAAEQASDLIVLAWRGAWEGEHGAVVKAVVRRTRCPVMIVRASD